MELEQLFDLRRLLGKLIAPMLFILVEPLHSKVPLINGLLHSFVQVLHIGVHLVNDVVFRSHLVLQRDDS